MFGRLTGLSGAAGFRIIKWVSVHHAFVSELALLIASTNVNLW
jgi:hypothetical protein